MLRSNQNLFNQITDLVGSATEEIIVFSPYVKYDALLKLLSSHNSSTHVTIITSWKPHDVAYGSTDLSIYPFCKDNGHTLLINNQIHLKSIIIDNMSKAYTGSANITKRGLGYGSMFNYEIGTITTAVDILDKIYFDMIIESSEPVNDDYYENILKQTKKLDKPDIDEEFDDPISNDKYFLLTSLPMCENIDEFFSIYSTDDKSTFSEEDIRSAEHDRRLYDLEQGLDKIDFLEKLKESFSKHPFVTAYKDFIDIKDRHFGTRTQWLHDNVTTVPTPKRREMISVQQRLNSFLLALDDNYDQHVPPGRHSEVMFRKK